jgi:hypothetical protein
MESIKSIKARLNSHDNIAGIPNGWVDTPATTAQLKKLNIVTFKAFIGWDTSRKRYIKPILVNVIRKKDKIKVDEYFQSKHNK